jgi:hypothetical protein
MAASMMSALCTAQQSNNCVRLVMEGFRRHNTVTGIHVYSSHMPETIDVLHLLIVET